MLFEREKKSLIQPTKNLGEIRHYILLEQIGKGSYGKIYLDFDKKLEKKVALKIINKNFLDILNKTEEAFIEQYMLKFCYENKNIINLLGCFTTKEKLIFVLDYYKNGNFEDYLKNIQTENGLLSYETAKFYLAEILNILKYLQKNNISHLDLKPNNFLLDSRLHLKLIDFSTAKIQNKKFNLKTKKFELNEEKKINLNNFIGTPQYCSPEILNNNVQNFFTCDVWSFGIIMYELFHNKTPFDDYNLNKMIENIKKGEFYLNEKLPNEIKDLIKKCLIVDQNKRIKLNEIFNHPFFKDFNFNDLYEKNVPENFKKSISSINENNKNNLLIEELYNEDDNDYINKKNNNVSTDAEIDYCSENSDEIEEKTYKKNKENLSKIIVGFDYCIVTFNDNNNSEIKENYY
jgi:serine/threonine protein kinase